MLYAILDNIIELAFKKHRKKMDFSFIIIENPFWYRLIIKHIHFI